jgi:hypothetical protein
MIPTTKHKAQDGTLKMGLSSNQTKLHLNMTAFEKKLPVLPVHDKAQ